MTIDNTPPTVADATLTPDPAYEDDVLDCAYSCFDFECYERCEVDASAEAAQRRMSWLSAVSRRWSWEALGALDEDSNHDCRIFSLAILLSS